MRYIINRVCVTYRIMFSNSRCNNITYHEALKQQKCFKHAGRAQEKQVHSFQDVSHEKLFDMKREIFH